MLVAEQPTSKLMADYKQELINFFTNDKTFPSENHEMLIQLLQFESYIKNNAYKDIYKNGKHDRSFTAIQKAWAFRRRLEIPMFGKKLEETERTTLWMATGILSRAFITEKSKNTSRIIRQRTLIVPSAQI